MNEKPFYFTNNGYRLFGVLHIPENRLKRKSGRVGIVFCGPFAEESLWAHRAMVNFARDLANHSYWVLRFNPMGEGDSEGNFEDATVETRISDIQKAVEVLKEESGATRIGLLGLRFGGALAALASGLRKDIEFLVLWNPVVNGEKYFQECLRSNIATQMTTYGKVKMNRKQITEDLLKGNPANIEGYPIAYEFYNQISKLNLLAGKDFYARRTLIVQSDKKKVFKADADLQALYEKLLKNQQSVEFKLIQEQPFWTEVNEYVKSAELLFSLTQGWVNNISVEEDQVGKDSYVSQ